jgi:hypothetical protein
LIVAALFVLAAFHDVRITADSPAAARALARERMSVYRVDGADVYAVAPDETIADLRARGLLIALLPDASPARDAMYRSPDDVNAALTALAAAHADVARLERLGTSRDGIAIMGVRVGDPSLPAVRVLGGHHGDEGPGVEVPLRWIEGLLAARATDPAIAASLAKLSLLVAPMVNPDGYGKHTRYNSANIDLNRNYGFGWRSDEFQAGPYPYSEPEVRAVALDNEWHRYASSLTYHTGALNIGYPYNYITDPQPTDARFSMYGAQYKTSISDPAFYVTRGALWFISYGDLDDYSLGNFGGADMTVEMSLVKTPPATMLDQLTAEHGAAATKWLSLTADTVRVEVTDAVSGEPLPATVRTDEISSVCDPVLGRTQLQANDGAALHVELAGYMPVTVTAAHGDPIKVPLTASGVGDRVLVNGGFVNAGDGAVAISLSTKLPLAIAHAWRPGAEDIPLTCDALVCSAPAAHRRPGHYALTVRLTNGGEITTPNALYLADETAGDPPFTPVLDNGRVSLDASVVSAAWIEHGGSAGLLAPDGNASPPLVLAATLPPSGRGFDVVYAYDGKSYRVSIVDDPGETAVPPKVTGKARACGHCGGGDPFALAVAAVTLLIARRRRFS